MCGIGGYILRAPVARQARDIDILLRGVRHRGPDDEGACLVSRKDRTLQCYRSEFTVPGAAQDWPDIRNDAAIIPHDLSLVFTRYSIIDLTEKAHQPFVSADASVASVFNGEIYNYIELRNELSAQGVRFRTTSDTEVLVEGYRLWGEQLWPKMNGFWAVALYDMRDDTVILSRDRIGVAPLYYRETPKGFFFSSCIQPLIDIEPDGINIDPDVILGFANRSIKDHDNTTCYRQIRSVPSLTTVIFHAGQASFADAAHRPYWHFPSSRLTVRDLSLPEAVRRYRETFFNSVELRLRADVKVAFELSGGLDSSSVVAAAARLRHSDITTYTAKVKGADEEPYARSLLRYYPVDYRVIERAEDGFVDDYEVFSKIMEEPYDNPNNYTHYKMLQRMKSEGVSVVVTGAGGDEILAGYEGSFWPQAYRELKESGHVWAADWYEFCRRFKTIRRTAETLKHYWVDLPGWLRRRTGGLDHTAGDTFPPTRAAACQQLYASLSFHERVLYHFTVALVPYYMRSSDHFTMALPIEHRFPLLDYRMVDLCLQMPIPYLFRNGWTKYLLRKSMEPYLPATIIWRRKKMGFTFPYAMYFRQHRERFEPLMSRLTAINIPPESFGTYDELLRRDPAGLWRLLSTAIWAGHQGRSRGSGFRME